MNRDRDDLPRPKAQRHRAPQPAVHPTVDGLSAEEGLDQSGDQQETYSGDVNSYHHALYSGYEEPEVPMLRRRGVDFTTTGDINSYGEGYDENGYRITELPDVALDDSESETGVGEGDDGSEHFPLYQDDDTALPLVDEDDLDGVGDESDGWDNMSLPDLDEEELALPEPDRDGSSIHDFLPALSEPSTEGYEEDTTLGDIWDPGADAIMSTLQQALAESEAQQSDEDDEYDDDEPADDREAVLLSLLGGGDVEDEDDDEDDLLPKLHEKSSFAAVDDDGIPEWFSLDAILSDAIDQDVSDIYIVPNQYVSFKKLGQIEFHKHYSFILPELTEKIYQAIITNVQETTFVEGLELDAAYVIRSGRHTNRRFRMSLGNTFGATYLNFRVIPNTVPSPKELGVPDEIVGWSKLSRGIFMINGPTGSGKSTTVASMVREIQLQEAKTIITIERPIEFEYPTDGKSLVIQRNVDIDTHSFDAGLKTSLRNAPDVIVVGEVRDREEVDNLLRAAETGHLAISTMHTETCAGTISRMTGLFEGSDKRRVNDVLSTVGRGFANQLLLRSPDGTKRHAIHEILTVDEEVAELIAKDDIRGIMAYQNHHEKSMDHELAKAYTKGYCTLETAYAEASRPSAIDRILKTM